MSGCAGFPARGRRFTVAVSCTDLVVLLAGSIGGQRPQVHTPFQPLAQLNTDPKSHWKQGDHQVRSKCSICTELLLTPKSVMGTNQCPCCHLGKWVPAGPESLVLALLLLFYVSILEESKGVFIRIGLPSAPSPHPFSKPY